MSEIAPLYALNGPAAPGSPAVQSAENTRAAAVAQKFEAAMLGPLVRQMLPAEDSSVWGGGAGKTWRGFYADEIARALAESGGVGIAPIIEDAIQTRSGDKG
ncbi:MAG: rod-binding protein [Pseudomonadota bacterium]